MSALSAEKVREVNRLFNDRLGKNVWQFTSLDEIQTACNHLYSHITEQLTQGWKELKQTEC